MVLLQHNLPSLVNSDHTSVIVMCQTAVMNTVIIISHSHSHTIILLLTLPCTRSHTHSLQGIFPASHVHIRECNVINPGLVSVVNVHFYFILTSSYLHTFLSPYEVVMPKEDPMAQEICDVLREWSNAWKRHYMVS